LPQWQLHVLPGIDHHPLFHAPAATQRAIAAGVAQVSLQKDAFLFKERIQ
jgi:hypothetical protein